MFTGSSRHTHFPVSCDVVFWGYDVLVSLVF